MGLLDQLAGQVLGGMAGGQGSGQNMQGMLMQLVLGMIQNQQGGLGGLLGKFRQAGLTDETSSWVSTGQNLPISGNQLEAALGADDIGAIASQLGLSRGDASSQLANLLPGVIDQLTPQGQVTDGDLLNNGIAALAKSFLR